MRTVLLSTLLLFAAILSWDCKLRKLPHETPEEPMSKAGTTEPLGMRVIQGTLYNTKGNMGEVAGIIIPTNYLRDDSTGGWKAEYLAMKGKRVEMKGEIFRYHCMPQEQCLQEGYIDRIGKIEYLKALE